MEFTKLHYLYFFLTVYIGYWALQKRSLQNGFLLIASYLFYGWIHPWFCLLLAGSTVLDFTAGLVMHTRPQHKKAALLASLIGNLGLLCTFKYFNFFIENVQALGLFQNQATLSLVLPVGISFYTFQTLSYTIDIYKGEMKPTRNFLDFALFISFFPQLVAGPIERAKRLIPQIAKARSFSFSLIKSAAPLLLLGYMKKMMVADNVALWVDRVFMLEQPSLILLFVGSIGFAIQIYADFSAYTDIARGSARLIGFELMENFKGPFLAISPSDFWRRWHISFSSWIRDYVYIPLGGSRVKGALAGALVLIISMGLSGLWHGAAWHFVIWGLYHAALLIGYRAFGFEAKWAPKGVRWFAALATFQFFSICGWTLFRAPSMSWLFQVLQGADWGLNPNHLLVAAFLLLFYTAYCWLWMLYPLVQGKKIEPVWQWATLSFTFVLANRISQQFIYFQF